MVPIKNSFAKNKQTWRGGHFMTYYTLQKKKREEEDTSWHTTWRANAPNGTFSTLCCSKFTQSCQVSERREGKTERQVMLPLVLLIKFVQLLIIFQISFSFNPLVANWRLSPEFWSPQFFSLAMATKMVAAWSAVMKELLLRLSKKFINYVSQ